MSQWITGRVIKKIKWTDYLFSIIVHADIKNFIAGQYTKLALYIDGKRIQRAYSYVNAPENQNLEFYIVLIKSGKLTPQLMNLKKNEKIIINKFASGNFTIQRVPLCKNLWMFATGTAIGPYLSILQNKKNIEKFENIILIHAVRFFKDLSYLSLMQKIEKEHKKIKIVTIISRESFSNSLRGRIPELILNGKLEKKIQLSINKEDSHVMLCGNPKMIFETQNILKNNRKMTKNLNKKPGNITVENYW